MAKAFVLDLTQGTFHFRIATTGMSIILYQAKFHVPRYRWYSVTLPHAECRSLMIFSTSGLKASQNVFSIDTEPYFFAYSEQVQH